MKILILSTLMASLAFSMPACDKKIKFKQKDGSTFQAHLYGDEYFSWVKDAQGNIIKYNYQSNNYEYAKVVEKNNTVDVVPSGMAVNQESNVSAAPMQNAKKISQEILSKVWERKRNERKYHH